MYFQKLKASNDCLKRYLYEQYDQQVGANTIVKPGLQSSVVRVEGTNKVIASTIDGEARYVLINHMRVERWLLQRHIVI